MSKTATDVLIVGGGGGAIAVLLQRLLHHVNFGRRVIDDQNEWHGHHLPMCVSMALNSSSLVKGLVR